MQVPQLRAEESLVLDLLEKDNVLVHPGYFFDFSREAFLVVSLLVDPAAIRSFGRAGPGPRHGSSRMMRRRSGIVVPLFSLVSDQGWGIGEFGDLPMFARWLMEAGQSIVQILPIHEMPPIETSPYSAMTAMALDPIYIRMAGVADFSGLGGELALDGAEQAEIKRLQQTPRIEYASIRRLKDRWLRRSFDRFLRLEVSRGTPRAARFDAFVAAQCMVAGRVRVVPGHQRAA